MTVADSRIDELRRRLERDPGSRLFAQLAEEHRKAGAHAEAIRVARAGLVQHPSYPSARLTLGRALLDSGDPAGARVELEAALRDAPDNILASRFLGQALDALGELGPALVQLQKTLKMAPGDRQLESQIVSLQTRLRSPQPQPVARAARGAPAAGASELTAPFPRPAAPAPPEAEDAEGGPLPPTIRIHMPGDRGPWGRTPPLPPPLPPTAAPPAPASGVRPPCSRREVTASAAAADAVTTLPASPPRMSAEPFYESDVAPTLPTAQSPGFGLADEAAAPTLPSGAVAAEETVFEAEARPSPWRPPGRPRRPRARPTTPRREPQRPSRPRPSRSCTSGRGSWTGRWRSTGRCSTKSPGTNGPAPGWPSSRARPPRPTHGPLDEPRWSRTIAGLEALLVVLQRR